MPSKWQEKKEKLAREQFERTLQQGPDDTTTQKFDMGDGEKELFEKKLSKEEKKALAKAKRQAKKRQKKKSGSDYDDDNDDDDDDNNDNENKNQNQDAVVAKAAQLLQTVDIDAAGDATEYDDGMDHAATDALAAAGTICTFSRSRKAVDARSRDINVTNFTLQHMGTILLDETEIILNHGNRYGLIGRNGCGKSTLLKALGARAVPIPRRCV